MRALCTIAAVPLMLTSALVRAQPPVFADPIILEGVQEYGHFGLHLSGAGDLNSDGFEDFLVSEAGCAIGGRAIGARLLLGSSAPGEGLREVPIIGQYFGLNAGSSVAGAGDLNGDGFADALFGVHLTSREVQSHTGGAYILPGGASVGAGPVVDMDADGVWIPDAGTGAFAGWSLAALGDADQDGFDDFAVGSPGASPGDRGFAGALTVLHGRRDLGALGSTTLSRVDAALGHSVFGRLERDNLSFAMSGAGDVNGDGIPDFLATAIFYDYRDAPNAGAAFLFWGGARRDSFPIRSLSRAAGVYLREQESDARIGFSVSGIGDFNGDGLDDFVVGAPQLHPRTEPPNRRAGAVFIVYGSEDLGRELDWIDPTHFSSGYGLKILGDGLGAYFGYSVSAAGDVNGDGFADVLIGAPGAGTGGHFGFENRGSAWLLLGGPRLYGESVALADLPQDRLFRFDGAAAGEMFGCAVSTVGDVNGDGAADFAISSPYASPNGVEFGGRVSLFLGNPGGGSPVWHARMGARPRGIGATGTGRESRPASGVRISLTGTDGPAEVAVRRDGPRAWSIEPDTDQWTSAAVELFLTVAEWQGVSGETPPVVSAGGRAVTAELDTRARVIRFETPVLGKVAVDVE